MAHEGLAPLNVGNIARVSEEGCLLKEVRPLSLAEVNVDLLEMMGSVVTRDTRKIDAEKNLAVKNRQFVVGIDLMNLAKVITMLYLPGLAFDMLANDRIHRSHHQVALGRPGNERAHEIVVRTVRSQALFQHVVEQLNPAPHLPVGPEQVHVEIRPFVDESRAADQTVDHAGALVGRVVSKKAQQPPLEWECGR